MRIVRATAGDRAEAIAIIEEYGNAIGGIAKPDSDDLAEYVSDPGALWLARDGSTTIGCIALRPLPEIEGACEVKRMYVRPAYRGSGLATELLDALHAYAAQHFTAAYLDTKDDLTAAIRFYERSGYERCERYNDNAQATIFMRRSLAASDRSSLDRPRS